MNKKIAGKSLLEILRDGEGFKEMPNNESD
jgi:hypothetical protein